MSDDWPSAQTLHLHLGEMTAQEMRTAVQVGALWPMLIGSFLARACYVLEKKIRGAP